MSTTSCMSCMVGGGYDAPNPQTQTGGKKGKKLEKETKKYLYARAQKYAIRGRSTMDKAELASAIRKKQQEIGLSISRRFKK